MSRRRKHEGTFADGAHPMKMPLVLQVIGQRPDCSPYLWIGEPGEEGRALAYVENANALRGLANAILRSLEPR